MKQEPIVNISHEMLGDLLSTAFEGGSNYWMNTTLTGSSIPIVGDVKFRPEDKLFRYTWPFNGGAVCIRPVETGDFEPFRLDMEAIRKGLRIWMDLAYRNETSSSEVFEKHFVNFVTENHDAETADVFLQLCVFGEVVYG